MGCHGSFSLDEATRRSWYNPETVLVEAGLRQGMTFVDVGCGHGFFSLLAAHVVGEAGLVYAVDSDKQAVQRLEEKALQLRLQNIRGKVALAEKTVFCTSCADIVFYSMVLHDFKDPALVLLNAKKMLKPSGVLVNLDWKKLQMPFGPPFAIRFSEKDAMGLMKIAGFNVVKVMEAGPYHYLILAKLGERC